MDKLGNVPKLGIDIKHWSDLDSSIPDIDLDTELFIRNNVVLASFVIIARIIKNQSKANEILNSVNHRYFSYKLFEWYLYVKLLQFFKNNLSISEEELEEWVPQFSIRIWHTNPPSDRSLYSDNYNLRYILKLNPTEEQFLRAIELRERTIRNKN